MFDLVVVGAGPAGACAALGALRRRPDAAVLLLDRAAFPRDKPCGDGIAWHVGDVLADLGVGDVLAGAPPIPSLRVTSPAGAVVHRPTPRPNAVVPRRRFDARLLAAAVGAGAALRRRRVRHVSQQADRVVVDGQVVGRVLVAADGANSVVRRCLGVPVNPPHHLAVAVRGYGPATPGDRTQRIDLVADDWPSYAWSFPTGTGHANVGYGLLRSRLRAGRGQLHDRLARLLPDAGVDPASLRTHPLPLSTWRPDPAHGRVLLAGDAASLVNPLTGEGIYYAVVSGRLAGEAAVTTPDRVAGAYRAALGRALDRHLRLTAALARAVRWPPAAEAAVAAAAGSQAVFDELADAGLGDGLVGPATLAAVATAGVRRRLRRGATSLAPR